nr:hypothetical protein [Tanacetum cinerariifolium]
YRLNPRYAIKIFLSCGALYGNTEDKILVPKPPKNCARCAKCGYLVDGPNCQGCALLHQELEENMVTHFPDFQNTFEPSNASTNVVNAPREPYVVKQDNGSFVDKISFDLNRAPDSPNQFHCFHCKDVLRDGEALFLKPLHKVLRISTIVAMSVKQEEKRIEEEQAAKARYWKIPACCDDDDDYDCAIIPILSTEEPIDSLSMGDEHLDTIPATESDEVIKSCVENLVPNPSESEGENGCDVPSCFTTFSNILFEDEYEFNSVDNQSLHKEDFSEKIFSNPLFEEEINFSKKIFSNPLFEEEISSIKKNQHHFNAESDLVESMLNHDSSIISSSSKIDSLLDEFAGELTILKSIPPGVDKIDCHPENEIRLSQRLLYDNSSPRLPEEFNFENSNAEIESFSPSPIPNEDSDYFMEEIDLFLTPDDPMPPSIEDDEDSEGDILFERLLHDDPIPLSDTLDFSYEVRIFLPFFTYLVNSPVLLSGGSKNKIFDPGITVNHFYSFQPGLSHRCETFKKFNTHRSHLNESPMEMLFSTCSPMDQGIRG